MRSNYSREEHQKIVEEYIQSGKSQTVFAPEYGIKPNTLSAWVTKCSGQAKKATLAPVGKSQFLTNEKNQNYSSQTSFLE